MRRTGLKGQFSSRKEEHTSMDYALGCGRSKALRSRSNRLRFRFVSESIST